MNFPLIIDLVIVGLLIGFICYAIFLNIRIRRLQSLIREMIPSFAELSQHIEDHKQVTKDLLAKLDRDSRALLPDDDATPSSFYSIAKGEK